MDQEEIFYEDIRKHPKFMWGDFGIYYEFQDPRPNNETTIRGINRSMPNFYGLKHLSRSKYSEPQQYLSDPLGLYIKTLSGRSEALRCPTCNSIGGLSHGCRAQCQSCGTWLETYGNSLTIWLGLLWKKETIFGTRYFYKGQEVSEKEYDSWQVYHKLL